jgi:hypothetical protein
MADRTWARYAQSNHARINRVRPPVNSTSYLGTFKDGGGRLHAPVYVFIIPMRGQGKTCLEWTVLAAQSGHFVDDAIRCS